MEFESLENLYKVDANKAVSGIPVELGFNSKDEMIVVTVAQMGPDNPNYTKASRKYDKALESTRYNRKKRQLVWAKIIAETVLIDWSGMIDKNKKEIKSTLENKIQALMSSEHFFLEIMNIGQDMDRFRPDVDDDEQSDDAQETPEKATEKN